MADGEGEAVAEIPAGEATPAGDGGEVTSSDAEILASFGISPEEAAAPVDGEATETPEGEKPPEEAKPKKKTRREFESFMMSEAELAKPDGLKKAADYWQKRQRTLDGIEIRHDERAAELETRAAAIDNGYEAKQRELDSARAYARGLASLRERLVNPKDIAERLDAIAELCERPGQGRDIWDGWAKWAIGGGKRPESNAEIARLNDTVAKLQARLDSQPEETRRASEAAEEKRISDAIAARAPAVIEMASDVTKYPAIAEKMGMQVWQDGLIGDIQKLRIAAKAKGQPLDLLGALSIIEGRLQKRSPAGAKPAAPASATPASPVAATVTSIAPSQARSMPVVREKTQEERDRDLANDTDYLASIGLM